MVCLFSILFLFKDEETLEVFCQINCFRFSQAPVSCYTETTTIVGVFLCSTAEPAYLNVFFLLSCIIHKPTCPMLAANLLRLGSFEFS